MRAHALRHVVLAGVCFAVLLACAPDHEVDAGDEVVVLLHGLGRSELSMLPLEARLEDAGFEVRNIDYPSLRSTPAELVAFLDERLAACCRRARAVHFVTHSLGGILARAYLAENRPDNLGRVVMLAPPNKGSEFVDLLGESELLEWAMGPTGAQLGTGPDSLPNRLPPVDFEVGVIAGSSSVNPLGGAVVPGESDGTVSVESTQLAGMADFLLVNESHTFIMYSGDVAAQVIAFLRTGRFLPQEG